VNRSHGAARDAGRYNKLLVAADTLEAVAKVASAARIAHYEMTQPWFDDGARILPTALYDAYANKMRDFRAEFNEAADKFCRDYPSIVAAAQKRLNGMFKAEDYPKASEVRALFDFDIRVLPCPDAADFRVSIAKEHADDIRNDIETRMAKALNDAMQEPVRRILETVGHMADRLKAYKPAGKKGGRTEGTFRDSLVQNVRDLVELLPAFNLTNDQTLDALTRRMRDELCSADAQTLRDDPKARKSVARAAESILDDAREFMA
jgi:hypothetical protein